MIISVSSSGAVSIGLQKPNPAFEATAPPLVLSSVSVSGMFVLFCGLVVGASPQFRR